jgi:hypothetical protein
MDHLVEPGIRNYFQSSFEECKQYKLNYYTKVLNIGLFILFVGIVSAVLYFKKKEKLTPAQKNKKNEEDRMYIINKIRSLQIKRN